MEVLASTWLGRRLDTPAGITARGEDAVLRTRGAASLGCQAWRRAGYQAGLSLA